MWENDYEMVIGLEVHAELKTKTKIFCGCPTTFGAEPNTQCCPVCTGMPGSLPVLNRKVVELAAKAGLATNCEIALRFRMDRKNYFYPDLPKAYQISQYDLPLCRNGYLNIETETGEKRIGITRIHIEEDAGKLIHDKAEGTLIDCNRCGVPLIEIVSEPDLRSGEEVKAYLKKLRSILLYTGVSDCKMNEGSLRCDVNLSVRKKGEKTLGVRTEMKNLNSFQFIGKAIAYEAKRQIELLQGGGKVLQETRRYDEHTGKTYAMRSKESLSDYRFFPEPDLPPVRLHAETVAQWKAEIPMLPDERKRLYVSSYGIPAQIAEQLTSRREDAEYFEQAAKQVKNPSLCGLLMQSELLPKAGEEMIPIPPERFAAVCALLDEQQINHATARKLISLLWEQDFDPAAYVAEHGLLQLNDTALLSALADEMIEKETKSVAAYLAGKEAAAQAIIGKVIGRTGGRGNPQAIRQIVLDKLTEMKK